MDNNVFVLLKEICPDFSPYHFLKTDMYKGKIIGGHNLYYKKGEDGKEGIILGKRDIAEFDLLHVPKNFTTYTKFDQSDAEYGWTGDAMVAILKHIRSRLNSKK